MKIKLLLFLSFALILCSCTPQYRIRSEAKIDTLNLCMRYSESYPDSLKAVFDNQASDFIAKFNKYEHAFLTLTMRHPRGFSKKLGQKVER